MKKKIVRKKHRIEIKEIENALCLLVKKQHEPEKKCVMGNRIKFEITPLRFIKKDCRMAEVEATKKKWQYIHHLFFPLLYEVQLP